jgi:Arylsulfatase A and related enzymes
LFSGQWASRHQSYKLKCPHFTKGENWNHTWPAILRRNNYHIGHIGKWQYHNNDLATRFHFHHGFEGRHWYNWNRKLVSGEDLARESTIRFLRERPKEKPFAVTVAFYPPKPVGNDRAPGKQWFPKNETRALYDNVTIPEPYNHTHAYSLLPKFLHTDRTAAEKRWYERYRTSEHYQEAMKNIYALITQVDQACKEIIDEVKKQGLYNNTMIIFTTDNGMFHGAHGLAGKWYPYQESIRVPLIIYDPRMPKEKVGTIDDSFTLNVDLAETILGAAGLRPAKEMQGRDISDLYLPNMKNGKTALERKPWRQEFFYEFSIFDEKFIPSSKALVRKKWKFIDWYMNNYTQLFDLENDPLELYDVKENAENANIVTEMRARLNQLRDGLKEPNLNCDHGKYEWIESGTSKRV